MREASSNSHAFKHLGRTTPATNATPVVCDVLSAQTEAYQPQPSAQPLSPHLLTTPVTCHPNAWYCLSVGRECDRVTQRLQRHRRPDAGNGPKDVEAQQAAMDSRGRVTAWDGVKRGWVSNRIANKRRQSTEENCRQANLAIRCIPTTMSQRIVHRGHVCLGHAQLPFQCSKLLR
jgi:hypothetical protein